MMEAEISLRHMQWTGKHAIITLEALEILDAGLKRLRQYTHMPQNNKPSPDKATPPFWFSEPNDYDINIAITDIDEAVIQYQTTVRRFKIAIEGLSNLARSLEIQMRKMDAVMRPIALANGISKIPDDVLAHIFECIYEPWPSEGYFRPEPEDLGLVCKRFQRVADSQPSLMRYFSSCMPIGRIERRLNQQAQIGLRVKIGQHSEHSDNSADYIVAFTKTLVPLAHRWEYLQFYHIKHTDEIKQAYENLKSLNLPRLERLAIWSEDWEAADDIYSTWAMPKLRKVILNNGVPMELPRKSNILECDLVIENDVLKNYIPKFSRLIDSLISLTTLRLVFHGASLKDSYEEEMGPFHLPNLRTFHADLYFREFNDNDYDSYDEYTLSDTGEAINRFILHLIVPRMESLRVTARHGTCWNEWTREFLCNLFYMYGESSRLRTLEFIQEGDRLSADHWFKFIFECPCNGNAVLSRLMFNSSDRSMFELAIPDHDEGVHGLRTLTFKDCRLSIGALEALLKLYTSGLYPNFEGITLMQCAGISRESLRGVVGSEYVVFNDD